MDPTIVPIISAIVGGVIGAAINQWVTHRRTMLAEDRSAVADVQAAGMEGIWNLRAEAERLARIPADRDLQDFGGLSAEAAPRALLAALGRAKLVVRNRAVRVALNEVIAGVEESGEAGGMAPMNGPGQSIAFSDFADSLTSSVANLTKVSLEKIGPRDTRKWVPSVFSRAAPESKSNGDAAAQGSVA